MMESEFSQKGEEAYCRLLFTPQAFSLSDFLQIDQRY